MDRRGFLGLLACLPFFRKAEPGPALESRFLTRGPKWSGIRVETVRAIDVGKHESYFADSVCFEHVKRPFVWHDIRDPDAILAPGHGIWSPPGWKAVMVSEGD